MRGVNRLGSKTFSAGMLNSFKQRLDISAEPGNSNGFPPHTQPISSATDLSVPAPAPVPATSTPANGYAYQQPVVSTPTNVTIAQPVSTPSAVSQVQFPPPVPAVAQTMPALQGMPVNMQNGSVLPQAAPVQQYTQPQAPVAPPPVVAAQAQNQAAVAQNTHAPAQAQSGLNPAQLQAIQSVVQANPNITADQLMQILAAMGVALPAAQQAPPAAAPAPALVAPAPQQAHYGHPNQDQQAYQRDRSRSPDYKRRRVTPPGRQSPVYGAYDPSAANETPRGASNDFDNRRERGRGKGRDNVRKRSPPRERMASPSIMGRNLQGANAPKPFGHDGSLPHGRIRGTFRLCFGVR